MAILTFNCAVWLMLIVGPFCCLIGGVWSMRSLTQNEGISNNNNNNNNDGSVNLRDVQGEQQRENGHNRHIVEQFASATDDGEMGVGRKENVDKVVRRNKKNKNEQKGGKRSNGLKKSHKSTPQKKPVDVVLLVDARISMRLWFMERIERVQNITRSWALQFHAADHRNRIAIAQFDFSHGKILLELGKWRTSSLNSAISQLNWRAEYEEDELLGEAYRFTAFTPAFIITKKIFKNSLKEDNDANNDATDRIAMIITDMVGKDDSEAKILREKFNVRIMVVVITADAELTKNEFYNDPENYYNALKKLVSDPENDIIFDKTGICRNDSECADRTKCFFPMNSPFGHNLGFCGCLPPSTTFDPNKYSVHDCCRMVPLSYYYRANLDGHYCYENF